MPLRLGTRFRALRFQAAITSVRLQLARFNTVVQKSGKHFVYDMIAQRRSLNWINVAFFRLNALVSIVFFIVTVAEVVFRGGFRLR